MSPLMTSEIGAATYEWITFSVLIIVGTILVYRYFKKRDNNILILAICIYLFSIAPIMQSFDIFFFNYSPTWGVTSLGYNMAFTMSAYANIMLALFFLRIYSKERANLIVGIYALPNIVNTTFLINSSIERSSSIIRPLLFYPNVTILDYVGVELSYPDTTRIVYLLVHLILAMGLYIYIISAANKSSKKDVTLKVKRGFQLIAIFSLCLLLAFTFFILDFIWGSFLSVWYSPWLYIGWTIAIVGAIMAYLGYIMPDWLKKRWEITEG